MNTDPRPTSHCEPTSSRPDTSTCFTLIVRPGLKDAKNVLEELSNLRILIFWFIMYVKSLYLLHEINYYHYYLIIRGGVGTYQQVPYQDIWPMIII